MDENLSYGEDYKFIPTTSIENGVGTERRFFRIYIAILHK